MSSLLNSRPTVEYDADGLLLWIVEDAPQVPHVETEAAFLSRMLHQLRQEIAASPILTDEELEAADAEPLFTDWQL